MYAEFLNIFNSQYQVYLTERANPRNTLSVPLHPNQQPPHQFLHQSLLQPMFRPPLRPPPQPQSLPQHQSTHQQQLVFGSHEHISLVNANNQEKSQQFQQVRTPYPFMPYQVPTLEKFQNQFSPVQVKPENPFNLPNLWNFSHQARDNQEPILNNNVLAKNIGTGDLKKKRTVFSRKMLQRLEGVYRVKRFISLEDKENLSRELGLTPLQVKIWFQNRRMKEKKMGLQMK